MKTINTQAGDDSDGKMWGLEGMSILIAVGGFVVGISIAIYLFVFFGKSPLASICYGIIPAVLGLIYVFTLRERTPKSYDLDLLETFLIGRSWNTKPLSKVHPLSAKEETK